MREVVSSPASLEAVRKSLRLLDARSRRRFGLVVAAQVLVSGLDLLAVLAVGLVVAGASAAALGGTSPAASGRLSGYIPQSIEGVAWLAALAGLLLITKSFLSLYLTRRTYRFLANRAATVSSLLASRVLALPLQEIQRRPSQELTQSLTIGVNSATVNTLGPMSVIIAESALVSLLLVGLAAVDVYVAFFTVVFFGLVGFLLQIALGRWAQRLGEAHTDAEVGSMTQLQHALRAYRELVVSNRRALFVKRFEVFRWRSAAVQADTFILSQSGKYVFEGALVLGAGALILILTTTRSLQSAILALTVFLLVATRIFPSLLRLQNAFTQLRNSQGVSGQLFLLVQDLEGDGIDSLSAPLTTSTGEDFRPEVRMRNVCVTYAGAAEAALRDVTLDILKGQSVAIAGATGAGKSTLADVILGVIRPTSGTVEISGQGPERATALWTGSIAYVPQDVAVLSGTVRDNVALGIPPEEVRDEDVLEALRRAHLAVFLESHRDGLDTVVGEHGVKLSGGQRQRLGIARALYTRPSLLVLDEATSALDSATEVDITSTLEELSGQVTTIIIAHRLATVRNCDLVVYLDHGRVTEIGTFQQVRDRVPSFDKQARLLGL